MILSRKIAVKVSDADKYGFNPENFYPVIGTKNKNYMKDGKPTSEYQFLVVNENNKAVGVFTSKCIIKLEQ